MHGGERLEGVIVVHEGIDVDDAVFFEMVTQMTPVMILQRVKPPCLFGLGITAWKHTEPIRLRRVSIENLDMSASPQAGIRILTR